MIPDGKTQSAFMWFSPANVLRINRLRVGISTFCAVQLKKLSTVSDL